MAEVVGGGHHNIWLLTADSYGRIAESDGGVGLDGRYVFPLAISCIIAENIAVGVCGRARGIGVGYIDYAIS